MRRRIPYVLLLAACTFVVKACASPEASQSIQSGKITDIGAQAKKLFPRSKSVEHVQNNHSDWGRIEEPFPGAKIQGPCHDHESDWRRSEKLSPRSKAPGAYCRDV